MRLIAIFAAASLSAVVLGAHAGALNDISPGLWLRNMMAWLIGAVAAAAVASRVRRPLPPVLLLMAPGILAATFLGNGLSGVYRWIEAGPLRLNAAMLILPMLAVTLASVAGPWRWIAALTSLSLLALQPDASQATALAAAAALIELRRATSRLGRLVVVAAYAGLTAIAWIRPDLLDPVPEVEGILRLASQVSPLLAIASLSVLAIATIAPGFAVRRASPDPRLAGAALTVCLGAWTLAPLLGAFPVPFMGAGPSPILGAWLGIGLLAGLTRETPQAQPLSSLALSTPSELRQ